MQHRALVTAMFETACRWVGERAFLIDDERHLTGLEAGLSVRQAAARLQAAGLRPGGVVAFLCSPSVDHAIAFFAVMRAGGVACCLHLRDTDGRLADTLREVAPSLVVADIEETDRAVGVAADVSAVLPVLGVEEVSRLARGGEEVPEHSAAADDLVAIILSSGTTGRPKQVLHSHRTLLATSMMAGPIYGVLGPADSMVVPMAPSFAAWIHTVLPFVAQRCRVVFQRRFEPGGYVDLIEQHEVTIAALVPTLWRMILPELSTRDLPRLRVGMFSGEPGTEELVKSLGRRVPRVRSVYLASEGGCGCGVVAGEEILLQEGMAGSAGQPVPGADISVVDPDATEFTPLPLGQPGEIALRGPSLSSGYFGQPELTERRFQYGWWRTGDLGHVDADRMLHVRGRLDNRINTGGIKVHAEEIEAALLQLEMIRQAAVVGVPDPQWGERIEAHVTLSAANATAADVAAAFERCTELPRSLRPKRFHIHEALPVGPTGKLYRRGLTETSLDMNGHAR